MGIAIWTCKSVFFIRMALVEIGSSIIITDAEIKFLRILFDVLVKHAADELYRSSFLIAERIHIYFPILYPPDSPTDREVGTTRLYSNM